MRSFVGVALCCLLLGGSTVAWAATRTETDQSAGVRLALAGRTLTAEILPSELTVVGPPTVRDQLYGKRVRGACATTFRERDIRRTAVSRVRRWPKGHDRVRFRFRRDISRRARWCIVEALDGSDIVQVRFRGLLVANAALDPRSVMPVEGYIDYFSLRDRRGRRLGTFRDSLSRRLRPGRYSLRAFQRVCDGNCANLDPPTRGCARRVRVPSGRTVRARVSVNFSHRCTLMLSSDRRAVQRAAKRFAARRTAGPGTRRPAKKWRSRCGLRKHKWRCRVRLPGVGCAGTLSVTGVPGRLRSRDFAIRCPDGFSRGREVGLRR